MFSILILFCNISAPVMKYSILVRRIWSSLCIYNVGEYDRMGVASRLVIVKNNPPSHSTVAHDSTLCPSYVAVKTPKAPGEAIAKFHPYKMA
jgi:hypothetical protein